MLYFTDEPANPSGQHEEMELYRAVKQRKQSSVCCAIRKDMLLIYKFCVSK